MKRTVSKRNSEKSYTSKPPCKPPPGDKTLDIDPDICLYEIEDNDKTEEGEDA